MELGKKLFEEGRYEESFKVFRRIGQDENQLNSDRAVAYHMMGVLVNFSPGLSEYEDESGLEYYKMALQFEEDISTLLNITSSFGESPDMHQDIQTFKSAYDRLMDRKSELDVEEIKMLKKKYILMKKLEQGK